jgi:MFS family permease
MARSRPSPDAAATTEADIGRDPAPGRTRLGRLAELAEEHPLWCVVAVAVVIGVGNIVWVVTHRPLGGWDVDEVGYLAEAFRWQRMVDPGAPLQVLSSVLDQDKGPLTMLVSVLVLLVGPNTVATAVVASALLHSVAAVAVAAITRRLAGPRPALVAGLVVLALPATLLTARSYQLAPAVGATLACAVWAVLASSRGRRWWPMLGFGLAVGLLMLSRTMAVAFVPGLVLGAALHLEWSRRTVRNVVASAVLALLVAAPWWWAQREPISEYLLGHGYGDAATGYGPGGLGERVGQRFLTILGAIGPVWLGLAVFIVIAAALQARRRHARPEWRTVLRSEPAVVWITVGAGAAALMSTANIGMYFELPLLVLAVPGVAALAAGLPPVTRQRVAIVTVGLSLLTLGLSAVDSGGKRDFSDPLDLAQSAVFVGLANFQRPSVDAEPRLGATDNSVRLEGMEDWWTTNLELLREVDEATGREQVVITVCGSGPLISANSFALASELDGRLREAEVHWLRTSADPTEMTEQMQPWSEGLQRVLVIVDSDAEPFPGETTVDGCVATAEGTGWEPAAAIELPDGGTATVLLHPDR